MKKELGYLALGAIMASAITGGLVHAQTTSSSSDQQLDPTVCQRMHEGKGFGFHGGNTEWLADHAQILGMSTEELQAALDSGQRLDQIAEAQGITQEQMHEAMQAQIKEKLADSVALGEITQEQADLRLQRMDEMGQRPDQPADFEGFKQGRGFGQMIRQKIAQ
ncbi:hypothetical protein H6761_03445 [Candidatus Nomurabacteria bacterium]|nr:hypothetical protein [Candidatus Nomurabacteria bacterium]